MEVCVYFFFFLVHWKSFWGSFATKSFKHPLPFCICALTSLHWLRGFSLALAVSELSETFWKAAPKAKPIPDYCLQSLASRSRRAFGASGDARCPSWLARGGRVTHGHGRHLPLPAWCSLAAGVGLAGVNSSRLLLELVWGKCIWIGCLNSWSQNPALHALQVWGAIW